MTLELPDNVASSEFLTMEGKQFSTSRGIQILVGDFLSRYDPDALRYFLTIAGPETQDTDFTWSEFVRRNNDELVATWGNLVNRTLQSAYKNFGVVPDAGRRSRQRTRRCCARSKAAFDAVGSLIEAARFRLRSRRRCESPRSATSTSPSRPRGRSSSRIASGPATILYVALRVVDSLKMLLAPFLPFSAPAPPRDARATTTSSPVRSQFETVVEETAPSTSC